MRVGISSLMRVGILWLLSVRISSLMRVGTWSLISWDIVVDEGLDIIVDSWEILMRRGKF